MKFSGEVYITAAREHMDVAVRLYQKQAEPRNYALAHYLAGLAVECTLRAYLSRITSDFDRVHDLYHLYKAAQFYDIVRTERAEAVNTALSEMASQWNSNHRFGSEAALRTHLRSLGMNRGIKGDFLKERTNRMINAAFAVVNVGVLRWTL